MTIGRFQLWHLPFANGLNPLKAFDDQIVNGHIQRSGNFVHNGQTWVGVILFYGRQRGPWDIRQVGQLLLGQIAFGPYGPNASAYQIRDDCHLFHRIKNVDTPSTLSLYCI